MSNSLFEKYIDYDDKKVIKIIRKILIIYSRSYKKLLLRFLYKWRKNLFENPINDNNNSNSQIEQQISFSIFEKIPLKRKIMYQKKIPYIPRKNKISLTKKKILVNNKTSKRINHSANVERHKTPTISKKEQEKLFNSLYNDNEKRKEKIKKLSKEKEEKLNLIYTFTPNIIRDKIKENYLKKIKQKNSINNIKEKNNNFINRLNNYEKLKSEKLNKIKKEIEKSIPHPKIIKLNPKQLKLISESQKYLKEKNKRLEKLKENILNEQGITFKPKLNNEINSKVESDILERNENFLQIKEIKLNTIQEDLECTFSPKINEKSTINQSYINSDVSERLYDYKNIYEKNLEDKKLKYEENYPFKPELSKNTNEILENKQKLIKDKLNYFENIIKENNKENDNQKLLSNNSNEKRLFELEESVKKINELSDENIISMQPSSDINNNISPVLNNEKNESELKKITENNLDNNNIILNENNSKEKIFDLPQNNTSIEDGFEMKYDKKIIDEANKVEKLLFDKKHILNGMNNEEKEKQTLYTTSNKTKSIVNLNYYENLIS